MTSNPKHTGYVKRGFVVKPKSLRLVTFQYDYEDPDIKLGNLTSLKEREEDTTSFKKMEKDEIELFHQK